MITPPIIQNEKERLEAVKSLNVLDTPNEERFDVLVKEASKKFDVPISAISIIDEDREWFKACIGLEEKEGKRDVSFCGHALSSEEILVVEDTLLDERFKDNPSVINSPHIRFYAGVRLFDHKSKLPIGVFCLKDKKPRKLSVSEIADLIDLASRAETELNKD